MLCAVTDSATSLDLLQTGQTRARPAPFHHGAGLSHKGRLIEGWERFIDRYRWDWFATCTFVEDKHPEAADKVFRVWISELQQAVAGINYHKKPRDQVRWVRGLEWQKRGTIHFHALLSHRLNLDQMQRRKTWEGEWLSLTGAFCSIYPCDSSGAVRSYIAKYCGKGGEVDCSPNLPVVERGRTALRV